jgi:hypothetical protein
MCQTCTQKAWQKLIRRDQSRFPVDPGSMLYRWWLWLHSGLSGIAESSVTARLAPKVAMGAASSANLSNMFVLSALATRT